MTARIEASGIAPLASGAAAADPLERHCAARAADDWMERLAADEGTRYLAVWPRRGILAVPTRGDSSHGEAPRGNSPRGDRLVLTRQEPFAGQPPTGAPLLRVYLGEARIPDAPGGEAASHHVVAVVPLAPAHPQFDGDCLGVPRLPDAESAADVVWSGLRELAPALGPAELELVLAATAIVNWHRTHTHCPRCGTATAVTQSGWVRVCPADGSEHFPRTDPAVIVAVTDAEDRLLLGANAAWGGRRYSTLAGFVEPGETLEAAVVREIQEEAGIRLHTVRYAGSQSWPLPASLMLAFTASTDDVEPTPDGEEIVDLRWFTRQELAAAVESEEIGVPTPASVARALVELWYGEPLPEPRQPENQSE
ncbi:NAD(+) diphosphatase [Zhihengliuella sp.]|uniref:NAD(+) diphosphatase n=1 Tax=Zhihengliuella sp. TaxID=1954483 RepID=UPI002811CB83|nr:NAD(+) diphosphatase [Zhihengliuella sp.]